MKNSRIIRYIHSIVMIGLLAPTTLAFGQQAWHKRAQESTASAFKSGKEASAKHLDQEYRLFKAGSQAALKRMRGRSLSQEEKKSLTGFGKHTASLITLLLVAAGITRGSIFLWKTGKRDNGPADYAPALKPEGDDSGEIKQPIVTKPKIDPIIPAPPQETFEDWQKRRREATRGKAFGPEPEPAEGREEQIRLKRETEEQRIEQERLEKEKETKKQLLQWQQKEKARQKQSLLRHEVAEQRIKQERLQKEKETEERLLIKQKTEEERIQQVGFKEEAILRENLLKWEQEKARQEQSRLQREAEEQRIQQEQLGEERATQERLRKREAEIEQRRLQREKEEKARLG